MAKRKLYRIKFHNLSAVGRFLYELSQWRVTSTSYSVNELTVITKSADVVDVATESFDPTEYEITTERISKLIESEDVVIWRGDDKSTCRYPHICEHPRRYYYCESCGVQWFSGWICPCCGRFGVIKEQ